MLKWDDKDPNEILDYELDWSARLGTDTIATSVWSVTTGSVVIGVTSFSTTQTKVWLSAGAEDEICELLNRVTTSQGRTMDQSVRLRIKSK
jgi:predicted component of type VI protein secretion system